MPAILLDTGRIQYDRILGLEAAGLCGSLPKGMS